MGCWNGPVSEVRVLTGTSTLSTLAFRLLPSLRMLPLTSETQMELLPCPQRSVLMIKYDQCKGFESWRSLENDGRFQTPRTLSSHKPLLDQIAMVPCMLGICILFCWKDFLWNWQGMGSMLVGSNPILLSLQGTRHRTELYYRSHLDWHVGTAVLASPAETSVSHGVMGIVYSQPRCTFKVLSAALPGANQDQLYYVLSCWYWMLCCVMAEQSNLLQCLILIWWALVELAPWQALTLETSVIGEAKAI